jgi:hypothetical protein
VPPSFYLLTAEERHRNFADSENKLIVFISCLIDLYIIKSELGLAISLDTASRKRGDFFNVKRK